MRSTSAIVTGIFGRDFMRIGEVSIPTIKAYADRIGADFLPSYDRQFSGIHVHWEKFEIRHLLERYERVVWMDADIIVSPRAPSILDVAPKDTFCAFDEGRIFSDRSDTLRPEAEFYGLPVPAEAASRPFNYFNAGVMVVGQKHRHAFTIPTNPGSAPMSEQAYTNLMALLMGFKFHDLGVHWNGLHSIRGPESRGDLHVVHYAGWPRTSDWVEKMTAQMRLDMARWQ